MWRGGDVHHVNVLVFYQVAEIVVGCAVLAEFFLGFCFGDVKVLAVNIAKSHKTAVFVAREMIGRTSYAADADDAFG